MNGTARASADTQAGPRPPGTWWRTLGSWRSHRFGRGLAAIVAAAVAIRLLWLGLVAHITTIGATDQHDYVRIGHAWAMGNFGTGLLRTPLYPAVLAVSEQLVRLTGLGVSQRLAVGLLQTLLAAATVAVVGAWVRHVTGSNAGGWAAALTLALWPNQVIGVGVLMSELVATPLLLFAAAAALWDPRRATETAWRFAVPIAGGLAILARPALLPAVVVLLAASLRGDRPARERVRGLASQAIALILVLLPWIVVSSYKDGRPSLALSSAGGFNLCLGNNDLADGGWVTAAAKGPCALKVGDRGELADAARLAREGLRWAAEHPGRQPGLVARRLERTFSTDSYWVWWYPDGDDYRGPGRVAGLREVGQAWWRIVVVLSAGGVIAGWSWWRSTTAWALAVSLATVALPMVSIGDARFHDPIVPFMAVMVGMLAAGTLRTSVPGDTSLEPCSPTGGHGVGHPGCRRPAARRADHAGPTGGGDGDR